MLPHRVGVSPSPGKDGADALIWASSRRSARRRRSQFTLNFRIADHSTLVHLPCGRVRLARITSSSRAPSTLRSSTRSLACSTRGHRHVRTPRPGPRIDTPISHRLHPSSRTGLARADTAHRERQPWIGFELVVASRPFCRRQQRHHVSSAFQSFDADPRKQAIKADLFTSFPRWTWILSSFLAAFRPPPFHDRRLRPPGLEGTNAIHPGEPIDACPSTQMLTTLHVRFDTSKPTVLTLGPTLLSALFAALL